MESLKTLRLSLVAVWLITGVVSLIELNGQSADLLKSAGLTQPVWIEALIWGGAGLDLLLGFALWWVPRKSVSSPEPTPGQTVSGALRTNFPSWPPLSWCWRLPWNSGARARRAPEYLSKYLSKPRWAGHRA